MGILTPNYERALVAKSILFRTNLSLTDWEKRSYIHNFRYAFSKIVLTGADQEYLFMELTKACVLMENAKEDMDHMETYSLQNFERAYGYKTSAQLVWQGVAACRLTSATASALLITALTQTIAAYPLTSVIASVLPLVIKCTILSLLVCQIRPIYFV